MRVIGIENGEIGVVLTEAEFKLLALYSFRSGYEAWVDADLKFQMPEAYDVEASIKLKRELRKVVKQFSPRRVVDRIVDDPSS